MTDAGDDLSDYVRRVRENTQKYLRDLLAENEKLCALVHTLERELEQHRKERLRIEERLAAIEVERRAYLERYLDVEAQNANVSNLYVAMARLHGSTSHADVLRAVHEIVVNLIGSEELAVFEMDVDRTGLRLVSSEGVDAASLDGVRPGVGIIGTCAQAGAAYVAGQTGPAAGVDPVGPEGNLTACVPLVVEGVVTGVVAVFRLLRHKPSLEPIDHELLALLGNQAAIALYSTSVIERSGERRSLHMRAADGALPR